MSGKKDKVLDQDRFSIITDNLTQCFLCGSRNVELHEVFHGTANRAKSKEYGLILPLCELHHRGQQGIHNNAKFEEAMKKLAEQKWIKYNNSNIEEFIKIFGKNYLEV